MKKPSPKNLDLLLSSSCQEGALPFPPVPLLIFWFSPGWTACLLLLPCCFCADVSTHAVVRWMKEGFPRSVLREARMRVKHGDGVYVASWCIFMHWKITDIVEGSGWLTWKGASKVNFLGEATVCLWTKNLNSVTNLNLFVTTWS